MEILYIHFCMTLHFPLDSIGWIPPVAVFVASFPWPVWPLDEIHSPPTQDLESRSFVIQPSLHQLLNEIPSPMRSPDSCKQKSFFVSTLLTLAKVLFSYPRPWSLTESLDFDLSPKSLTSISHTSSRSWHLTKDPLLGLSPRDSVSTPSTQVFSSFNTSVFLLHPSLAFIIISYNLNLISKVIDGWDYFTPT